MVDVHGGIVIKTSGHVGQQVGGQDALFVKGVRPVRREASFSVPETGQVLSALTTLGIGVAFEVQVDVALAG